MQVEYIYMRYYPQLSIIHKNIIDLNLIIITLDLSSVIIAIKIIHV